MSDLLGNSFCHLVEYHPLFCDKFPIKDNDFNRGDITRFPGIEAIIFLKLSRRVLLSSSAYHVLLDAEIYYNAVIIKMTRRWIN